MYLLLGSRYSKCEPTDASAFLNRLLHWWFVTSLCDSFAGGRVDGGDLSRVAVQFHQLVGVESRPLEDLDLTDVDLLDGVDSAAALLDVHGDGVRNELVDELLQVAVGNLAGDDRSHLGANSANL